MVKKFDALNFNSYDTTSIFVLLPTRNSTRKKIADVLNKNNQRGCSTQSAAACGLLTIYTLSHFI